jgi:hypothetical protein
MGKANETPLVHFQVDNNGDLTLVLSQEVWAQVQEAVKNQRVTAPDHQGLVRIGLPNMAAGGIGGHPYDNTFCPPTVKIAVVK